jgi:hypothetical protein
MWLKAKAITRVLEINRISRHGLARALDIYDEKYLGKVLDGLEEADEETAEKLVNALGAKEMMTAIDFRRTRYAC